MTVTASQLRQLVSIPEDKTDDDLQIFLDAANVIVTENLSSSGLTAPRLRLIEQQLAAHFAVVSLEFGGLQSWFIGQSREHYKTIGADKEGLSSTRFGQQALALDTSGILSRTLTALKASIKIGKPSYTETEFI